MTVQEFSLEFDALYNNLSSNQAPGLNAYEKSVFLTQAQESVVVSLYGGTANAGFETSEATRGFLSELVREHEAEVEADADGNLPKAAVLTLPEDVWFKVYERATVRDAALRCGDSEERVCDVFPVTHDTLYRTASSPFRGANARRVLRLDVGPCEVELLGAYPIASYFVRYLRRPDPIILEDLSDTGLTVNGQTAEATCRLHTALHRSILMNAVTTAKAVWSSGTAQAQSQTNS